MGIDLIESEFDEINARITAACNADGLHCEAYAGKFCKTEKGYWMPICNGYEQYFTQEELSNQVEYVPLIETEETIEL